MYYILPTYWASSQKFNFQRVLAWLFSTSWVENCTRQVAYQGRHITSRKRVRLATFCSVVNPHTELERSTPKNATFTNRARNVRRDSPLKSGRCRGPYLGDRALRVCCNFLGNIKKQGWVPEGWKLGFFLSFVWRNFSHYFRIPSFTNQYFMEIRMWYNLPGINLDGKSGFDKLMMGSRRVSYLKKASGVLGECVANFCHGWPGGGWHSIRFF